MPWNFSPFMGPLPHSFWNKITDKQPSWLRNLFFTFVFVLSLSPSPRHLPFSRAALAFLSFFPVCPTRDPLEGSPHLPHICSPSLWCLYCFTSLLCLHDPGKRRRGQCGGVTETRALGGTHHCGC